MTWIQAQLDDEGLFPSKVTSSSSLLLLQYLQTVQIPPSYLRNVYAFFFTSTVTAGCMGCYSSDATACQANQPPDPMDVGELLVQLGVPFPKNFLGLAKSILRRMFRVYAHIYHSHFQRVSDRSCYALRVQLFCFVAAAAAAFFIFDAGIVGYWMDKAALG